MQIMRNSRVVSDWRSKRHITLLAVAALLVSGLLSLLMFNNYVLAQEASDDQHEVENIGNVDDGADSAEDADSEQEGNIPMPPEEQITVPAEELFNLETSKGTQSVFNGRIPIFLYVKPYIDSSKAQVEWEVPRGLEPMGEPEQWFKMEKDRAETFKLYVIPEQSGHYEIVANVTAWRYDTNYVDSVVVEIEIDDELLVAPRSPEYQRNKTFLTLGIGIGIIGVIVGAYFLVKLGIKKFKVWMASD